MELLIILATIIIIAAWWIWKENHHEKNGHPLESLTNKLDINHDGKVDTKDVTAAAQVVVEETKKVATKTKTKVKEAAKKVAKPRKPSQPKK